MSDDYDWGYGGMDSLYIAKEYGVLLMWYLVCGSGPVQETQAACSDIHGLFVTSTTNPCIPQPSV